MTNGIPPGGSSEVMGYSVHVKPGKEQAPHGVPLRGIIFIGCARKRDRRGPFRDHYTGTSSLRRSLGALLKQDLGLAAVPSGSGRTERDRINYRFTAEGEKKLTDWINSNLEVRPLALENNRRAKLAAIAAQKPTLCQAGWRNPHAAKIRELRKVCSDEARAAP